MPNSAAFSQLIGGANYSDYIGKINNYSDSYSDIILSNETDNPLTLNTEFSYTPSTQFSYTQNRNELYMPNKDSPFIPSTQFSYTQSTDALLAQNKDIAYIPSTYLQYDQYTESPYLQNSEFANIPTKVLPYLQDTEPSQHILNKDAAFMTNPDIQSKLDTEVSDTTIVNDATVNGGFAIQKEEDYNADTGYQYTSNYANNLSNLTNDGTNKSYFSIFDKSNIKKYKDDGNLCRIYGGLFSMLNLSCVWLVVGLHCDKYCAIATPLKYNQIVTKRKIIVYSITVWCTAFVSSLLLAVLAPAFRYIGGVCLPVWQNEGEIVFTACLGVLLIVFPATLLILVNGKILLIARQHQHRIFGAIFEVMMSAQATVTQQRNPFDIPKMKQKSVWAICEQMIVFAFCYCPVLFYMFLDCIILYPLSDLLAVMLVGTLLLAPILNSFIYGVKSATVKKIVSNYLRKKISKSAMKCEIQARIPSAANSRRPSISSTLGFPAIHKSLQRRMSDYFNPCNFNDIDFRRTRRSSDLSWHPLEDGTPTSSRLRDPLDIELSPDWNSPNATSASQYLAVPSFDTARSYGQSTPIHQQSTSIESEDETDFIKDMGHEEDLTASADLSPFLCNNGMHESKTVPTADYIPCSTSNLESSLLPNGNAYGGMLSASMPIYRRASSAISSVISDDSQLATSQTPLLCRAYMQPWPKTQPSNTNSPYIMRTLESLMSVGLSQSRLLKSGSLWRANSQEKIYGKCTSFNYNMNSAMELSDKTSLHSNHTKSAIELSDTSDASNNYGKHSVDQEGNNNLDDRCAPNAIDLSVNLHSLEDSAIPIMLTGREEDQIALDDPSVVVI